MDRSLIRHHHLSQKHYGNVNGGRVLGWIPAAAGSLITVLTATRFETVGRGKRKKKSRDAGKPTGMIVSSQVKRFDVEMRLWERWKMRENLGEGWGKVEGRLREAAGSMWEKKEKKKPQPWARTQQKCGTRQSQYGCVPVGQPLLASRYTNSQCEFFSLFYLFLMRSNYNNLGKQVTKLRISKMLLAAPLASLKSLALLWWTWVLDEVVCCFLSPIGLLETISERICRSAHHCQDWWCQLVSSMSRMENKTITSYFLGIRDTAHGIFFSSKVKAKTRG